jgi:hypothetical protein
VRQVGHDERDARIKLALQDRDETYRKTQRCERYN